MRARSTGGIDRLKIPQQVDAKAVEQCEDTFVGKPDALGLKAIQNPWREKQGSIVVADRSPDPKFIFSTNMIMLIKRQSPQIDQPMNSRNLPDLADNNLVMKRFPCREPALEHTKPSL